MKKSKPLFPKCVECRCYLALAWILAAAQFAVFFLTGDGTALLGCGVTSIAGIGIFFISHRE